MSAHTAPCLRGLDGKGRVVLPVECRAMLNGEAALAPARVGEFRVLLVLTPTDLHRQQEEALAGDYHFWSLAAANGAVVPICRSTGRILIPELLRDHLGVRRASNVVIRGHDPVFEILRWADWKAQMGLP